LNKTAGEKIKKYRNFAQKDRIERLIADILNSEDYSKLKEAIKESVKAVLSNNKKLISVSFTALIQTLKIDPQMVKLIQDIAISSATASSLNPTLSLSQ
jgi:hypothetical protein